MDDSPKCYTEQKKPDMKILYNSTDMRLQKGQIFSAVIERNLVLEIWVDLEREIGKLG